MITSKVRQYFDKMSIERDKRLTSCPILNYEQDMRQEAVYEMLDIEEEDRILDVGCGNARDILLFAEMAQECVGIDLSKGMLKEGIKKLRLRNARNTHLILCDGTNLPFPNEVFDKVSCSEVIEHIPDYEKCVKETVRALKKDGRLVITTPNKCSLYGLVRTTFSITRMLRKKRKRAHPYDKWKTQEEVIDVLSNHRINVDKRSGICFVPSQISYRLPKRIKRLIVLTVFFVERRVRNRLNNLGYGIGLSGIKIESLPTCKAMLKHNKVSAWKNESEP